MAPEKTLDVDLDDDAELLLLNELLSKDDDDIAGSSSNLPQNTTAQRTENATDKIAAESNKVPRLVEDDTFAKAFSYDIPAVVYEKPTQIEDIDSSDEEEMSNFLERKYNEYGRELNDKLKQQRQAKHQNKVDAEVAADVRKNGIEQAPTVSETPTTTTTIKNPHKPIERKAYSSTSFTQTPQPEARQSTWPTVAAQQPPQKPIFTDPVFGFRLVNPLISSALLVERMAGRKAVSFAELPVYTERGDLSKDWVIAGALLNKSPVRKTKTDQPFSIWSLSDLRGEMKTVSLFLFKGAHKDLHKTAEGMCVAVLNPGVFDRRSQRGEVASLSIDTAHKVMVLGQAKDMGICKARKKNGDACTAVVNTGDCEYCVFHMQQEYSKMSRRSELQSETSGRGLNELRNKVLGKSEVFYGGQSFSAIPARKNPKLLAKDRERMSTLSEYANSPFAGSINHTSKPRTVLSAVPYAERGGVESKLAANVDTTAKQRLKDVERLRILQEQAAAAQQSVENSTPNKSTNANNSSMSSPPATPSTSKAANGGSTTPSLPPPDEKFRNREFSFSPATPRLSRDTFSIEVNIGSRQAQLAKQKAAQVLKQSPIAKANPNAIRGTSAGKRRAIDELNDLFINSSAKRQRLEEEQRANERKSRLARIMDATSSHQNLIDMREQQEQEQYFSKLEKKEALEEKMLNTYKMPCKAVICQRCKYTAFSAAQRCKDEKHPLKIVDAEKRFFQCKDCGNRTSSVFKLPKMSCKNCKGSRWARAAMIRERKVCDGSEGLSLRGNEETFLGSLAGTANLNLLVPDEE